MGSKTDLPVMEDATRVLEEFSIPYDIEIVSAHRTPEEMQEFSLSAAKNGFKVIIAGAGGAAHLPGMVASYTTLPVIGVPVTVGPLKGLDALLSIVQMPKGVPVATVAVDNAYNAGLLAVRILGTESKELTRDLLNFRKQQKIKVKKMNKSIRS
ncbi:MAG: 5-(carboxyamino)imidazole ribonucleotide mutase [Pseudobdellovibrionaceae bacterium]